tara:strand:+ start:1254 stop:1490 length:237 start_codon:yes stop_codon:yes gene_type:complete
MEFYKITEDIKAYPGEYIYHVPTKQIVLCGSFNREQNCIRVLSRGRLFTDKIQNFQKIMVKQREAKKYKTSGCKGCGK